MKEYFRQSMAWLHTWSGLLPGWILYFIFVTGSLGYFDSEIDRWMQPELPMAPAVALPDAITRGLARLQQVAPHAQRWAITLPDRDTHPGVQLSWRNPPSGDNAEGSITTELLEGGAARPIKPRQTGGGQLLYQMHWGLRYMEPRTAYWLVGACTMLMLVALITGVITHRKIFKEFFTFRPGKDQRSWLDAHNVLSVVALPFHIMIVYSGLVFMMYTYMPVVLEELSGFDEQNQQRFFYDGYRRLETYSDAARTTRAGAAATLTDIVPILSAVQQRQGKPLVVSILNHGDINARIIVTYRPNKLQSGTQQMIFAGVSGALLDAQSPVTSIPQQVNQSLLGLHEGLFAGPLLRWLYFLSGLAGCVMIATGLVLWTAKRRAKRAGGKSVLALYIVERLNAGVLVGLPIGIAAYFWANRLIPIDMEYRSIWELNILFLTWLAVLIYSVCRPGRRLWIELFVMAAIIYGLLPVLNYATTDRHLGITLPYDHWRGDWALAGFDLTMLGCCAIFAAISMRIARRQAVMQDQSQPAGRNLLSVKLGTSH